MKYPAILDRFFRQKIPCATFKNFSYLIQMFDIVFLRTSFANVNKITCFIRGKRQGLLRKTCFILISFTFSITYKSVSVLMVLFSTKKRIFCTQQVPLWRVKTEEKKNELENGKDEF